MKKIFLIILFPLVAFAEGLTDLMFSALDIINKALIPIAFSLCLVYFFWGVVKYLKAEGQGKAEGRSIMIWGVVGLFVASSVWGIITFIRTELKIPEIEKIEKQTVDDIRTHVDFGGIVNP